ncbi:hypothetical protein GW17_00025945 [Ensete ventricosum]|nr:hypothetical protein GW17_00025945 [Ensete ventricosum]
MTPSNSNGIRPPDPTRRRQYRDTTDGPAQSIRGPHSRPNSDIGCPRDAGKRTGEMKQGRPSCDWRKQVLRVSAETCE